MQIIKKVCFCTKLFKNTIFTMDERWRFQRYRICLKNLEIRINIEKLNFFLVHLKGSIKKNWNSITNPKLRKKKSWGGRYVSWCVCVECSKQTQNSIQTQNSERKNRGAGVKHCGVCVECSKQTQNSITNPKLRKKCFFNSYSNFQPFKENSFQYLFQFSTF